MRFFLRLFIVVFAVFGLTTLCHAASERPRLVVVVVVDQLPEWALELYKPLLADDGGIQRLLEDGVWFRNAWFPHAATMTAVGHSVLSTGTTPRTSGILGNSWYDAVANRAVYCVADERYRLVGADGAGVSPLRLRVPTVGDMLRIATAGTAKVIAVAGKDRAAALTAGRSGLAFWYSRDSGAFISSTFYCPDGSLPEWVERFNEAKPVLRYAGMQWELMLPVDRYVHREDRRTCEPPNDATFPHRLPGPEPLRTLASAVYGTPFLNELVLRLARSAVQGEELGQDAVPDLLWIGLSANDAVGHRFGPMSLEYQDCLVRTDRALGRFFAYLDEALGSDGWAAVLSADHGVAPCPEQVSRVGVAAARVDFNALRGTAVAALSELTGNESTAREILAGWGNYVYLRRNRLAELGLSLAEVQRHLARRLQQAEGVLAAYAASDLLAGDYPSTDEFARSAAATVHPVLGPDVVIVLKPFHIPGSGAGTGTTHGSPHPYDARVPVILRWPGADLPGAPSGEVLRRVYVTQVAPTVGLLLGVPLPGRTQPLPEIEP